MTIRSCGWLVAIAAALLMAAAPAGGQAPATGTPARPNVLWISVEDMSPSTTWSRTRTRYAICRRTRRTGPRSSACAPPWQAATTLRAKVIRYGYAESAEAVVAVTIDDASSGR